MFATPSRSLHHVASAALFAACLIGVFAFVALAAPSADAANRWTSPTGSGGWPCVQSSPCSLTAAAANPGLQDGDHVVLSPGNYEVGAGFTVAKRITLRAASGSGRPSINGIGPGGTQPLVSLQANGTRVVGVGFNLSGGSAWALRLHDADIDRVYIVTSASSTSGIVATGNTYIRNSVLRVTGDISSGINTGTGHTRLVNSTIVATSASGVGIASSSCYSSAGQPQRVSVANSYVSGGDSDFALYDSCPGPGKTIDVTTRYSSYDPANVHVDPTANMTLTPGPGLLNRISRPAQFVNPSTGNFRQKANSPTINRGNTSTGAAGSLGSIDYFGVARLQGGKPDIGAAERPAKPKIKAKGKSKSGGQKISLKVRCDENCRLKISGGVKSKSVKNMKANKWKTIVVKVKNPGAAKATVKVTAIDTDGSKRSKLIRVGLG